MNDKIWFTYKARIRAHERLASNDFYTQVLMVWYALVGAVLAVIAIRFPTVMGHNTDLIAAIFSLAILVISMLVANRDFRGRSIEMRLNYLALQALFNEACLSSSTTAQADIANKYQQLLSSAENHAEIDDKFFRVFHAAQLTSRIPTNLENAEVYAYLTLRIGLIIICYALPVLFALFTLGN